MTMKRWTMSEARAHLSDLLSAALRGDPQIITRRGEDAVVVVSMATYRAELERPSTKLSDFFANSPHRNIDVIPPRD
jgi:antitoxin Phd